VGRLVGRWLVLLCEPPETIGNRLSPSLPIGRLGRTVRRFAPSELTRRPRLAEFRPQRGPKLIWGGEAVAVRHDGGGPNPNQLLLNDDTLGRFRQLARRAASPLIAKHFWAAPTTCWSACNSPTRVASLGQNEKRRLEPRIVYRHPYLDARFNVADDRAVLSDDEGGSRD